MTKKQLYWLIALLVILLGTVSFYAFSMAQPAKPIMQKSESNKTQSIKAKTAKKHPKDDLDKTSNIKELGYRNDSSVWNLKTFGHYITRNEILDPSGKVISYHVNEKILNSKQRNYFKYLILTNAKTGKKYWGMDYNGEIYEHDYGGKNLTLKDTRYSIHPADMPRNSSKASGSNTKALSKSHIANAKDFAEWVEENTHILDDKILVKADDGQNLSWAKDKTTNEPLNLLYFANFNAATGGAESTGFGTTYGVTKNGTVYIGEPAENGIEWEVDTTLTSQMQNGGEN